MSDAHQRIILLTGPSGAGRSTAIRAMEDLGFEAIDNLPLSLLPRLLDGPPISHDLVLGLDVRNRDFSANALIQTLDRLQGMQGITPELLYIDCRADVLLRRFSETRRRHPLAPAESPDQGVQRELDLLIPIRARADILIDTSEMTPHDLRAEVDRLITPESGARLAVSVNSFSYKRGLPRGVDMVLDCRFLRNPYWEPSLRSFNGTSAEVAAYVAEDERFQPFFDKTLEMAELLLPAYLEEGKAHFALGFGCTGGQHRSVAIAEKMSQALAERGWQVSTRHRELERADQPKRSAKAADQG
ncbi:MAG: RNase adapter RapZ [Pseudomonadota bacterium]|uniref:GlmZ(SRNA)-inactivating NTPase n=1 Tax=Thalassovita autumnalis TaxID=2072972 RepID=A0A0P1F5A2_9RHOB|nr:RNase adapter RapZ [Thalassovita autumnalis]MEC8295695.1 RNase adapter RapZ [Pseudomonadota bacterium]CUH62861.1 glmZ(sRNA)-inactivating NTPase [Thalassovita autumnalis]CUH72189.1 glmZ(sRNA)-inactivating NTPase [Thalassovita autumnalis]